MNYYALSPRDKALIALLWPYLEHDIVYMDRVHTSYGAKTQYELARCIEAIFREYHETEPVGGK